MPIIIPDYTSYVGNSLTKLSIKAPYSLQSDIDSSIEFSGLGGNLIESLAVEKLQAGIINVLAQLGQSSDASKIELDGNNTRIVLYEDLAGVANPQVVITI